MPSPTQEQGFAAESAALDHLMTRGLRQVARNFRTKFGEIDLIMIEGQVLVFVEVRLRRSTAFGTGADTVTPAKQRRLIRAAKIYVARHHHLGLPSCSRFDVVSVTQPNCTWAFDWIRDAFCE